MLRRLLTPGWIALHVLALSAVVGMLGLGRWQWHRGVELDRIQNYSYAVEWWLFAAFAVFLWVKTMADSLDDSPDDREQQDDEQPAAAPASAPQAAVDDEDDPELAAYNARLRELHARTQRDA